MTTTIRSRKVRRILRLEARADRQATREARAASRATLLQRRVDALRTEARALEASLNGAQRAELGRARTCPEPASPSPSVRRGRRRTAEGPVATSPTRLGTQARHQDVDGPRCPVIHGEAAADGVATTPEPQEV